MLDFYNSQLDKIQDSFISGQTQLNKATTKDVIATIRQIKSQLIEDLDRKAVLDVKYEKLDILQRIINLVEHGEESATTTGISQIDNSWRWRRGETNIWTGYGNEGKSAMLNFLTLIKCRIDKDQKAAIFSPENQPEEFFYMDFIRTMLGTDPKPHHKEEVYELVDWLRKNIFFVYPDGRFTLENIHNDMRYLIDTKGVTICIVDPYLKVAHDYAGLPEHHYVSQYMTEIEHFARNNNVSYHVVAHQTTPQIDYQKGDYPKPNGYKIKGGGSFYDGADNVLTLWRPYRLSNYKDPLVIFESQKIKKQKIVAIPSALELKFNYKTSRYESMQGQDLYLEAMNETPF